MILLNIYVILCTKKYIFGKEKTPTEKKEYVIVPGAGLTKDKKPSKVLSDRLEGAIFLYQKGLASKIIISGDHQGDYYSETESMEKYLLEKGIPHDKIFRDDKGFSTFETIKNAKERFYCDDAYFASQAFHLPRMVFSGRKIGIDSLGFQCNFHKYSRLKHTKWKIREFPSRIKDFILSIVYKSK